MLRRVHVFDSSAVRRELFKLNYKRGEYMLNYEADAFEVFDHLLTIMHTWAHAAGQPGGSNPGIDWKNSQLFSCDRAQGQPCFIHNMFFLDARQSRVCTCGKSDAPQTLDRNLFAETVFMEDLVSTLDDMVKKSPDGYSFKPEIKNKAIIG